MRLGTGFVSLEGRGSVYSCEAEDIAILIVLSKQCKLEVENIVTRDTFGSKANKERVMNYKMT